MMGFWVGMAAGCLVPVLLRPLWTGVRRAARRRRGRCRLLELELRLNRRPVSAGFIDELRLSGASPELIRLLEDDRAQAMGMSRRNPAYDGFMRALALR